ncbi:phosphatase PAP2 family protein [bacterium]|nr:phosphatase PAP2 family protein [bacterium]
MEYFRRRVRSKVKKGVLKAFLILILGLVLHFWRVGDRKIFLFINSFHQPWLDNLFFPLTFLGEGVILAVLVIALGSVKGWGKAIKAAIILITVVILIRMVKYFCPCLQPADLYSQLHILGSTLRKYSFPSGHSAGAIALATYLGKEIPSLRRTSRMIAFLVAFSCVYVGAHFPGDIIFGSGLGYLIAILIG